MKLRRTFLALAAVMAPALACQLLVGIEDDKFRVDAVDAATVVEAGIPDPCVHAVPPSRPTTVPGGASDMLIFALKNTDVTGRTDAGALAGYDLDNSCTCDTRPGSANGGAQSCTAPDASPRPAACDDDAGVDNALAYLFDELKVLSGLFAPVSTIAGSFGEQTRCGRQALLLVVAEYNGLKDDSQIVLFPMESAGIRTPHAQGDDSVDAGCGELIPNADAGVNTYPAKFDGTDQWSHHKGALNPNGVPTRNQVIGWVKDFTLVIDGRDPEAPLEIPVVFGSSVVVVSTAVVTARLVPVDETTGLELTIDPAGKPVPLDGGKVSFRMDNGVVAGRAPSKAVLAAMGGAKIGPGDTEADFLCGQPEFYETMKSYVCGAVDSLSQPKQDFKQVSCDALAIVVQFDAVIARHGMEYSPPTRSGTCGPSFQDECR